MTNKQLALWGAAAVCGVAVTVVLVAILLAAIQEGLLSLDACLKTGETILFCLGGGSAG